MACHKSGKEGHPGLRETAADTLQLKNWKPPEGGDQWGNDDLPEPTKYVGTSETAGRRRPQLKQFARRSKKPISTEAVA